MLSESHGMSLLKEMAASQLKTSKNRVWSEEYAAWGFFADDITMFDEFLLWCSISPGDRITLDAPKSVKDFFVVVDIKRDIEIKESPIWVFKLLGPETGILDVKVKEKELFLEAAKHF